MNVDNLRAATPDPKPHYGTNTRTHAHARTVCETPTNEALTWCVDQHERRHGPMPYPGGGRNNWLTALAFFCNERGVPLAELEAYTLAAYTAADFTAREIELTVRGIYQREARANGSRPYTPSQPAANKSDFAARSEQKETGHADTPPTFPPDVYDALPDFLQRACRPFSGHEKALMLLGSLTVLSGCFPAVGGTYHRRRYGLNLFAFVIAPAASGKGTLAWARRLAWPYHKALTDASRAARAEYEAELAAYKSAGKAKASLTPPPGTPPPYRMLYLPGNTTAAALLTALAENEGRGIICETETDTLTGALGADFGNFSDVLRKAFQHESVSLLRKTDRQHLDLANPSLSIALTGTPGQLPRLMPSSEDGLVSRFLFYVFEQPPTWQDVSPAAGPPLDPYFDALAAEVSRMIDAVPLPDTAAFPVEIALTPDDWQRLNTACAAGLSHALAVGGGAGASTAFRLGLIAWRVAGLLTLLRRFEYGQAPAGRLEAEAADVTTALAIVDTARAHALAVLDLLPVHTGSTGGKFAAKAGQLARVQELHAQGLSYREIAEQTGVPFSTVRNWLKAD